MPTRFWRKSTGPGDSSLNQEGDEEEEGAEDDEAEDGHNEVEDAAPTLVGCGLSGGWQQR